MAAAIFLCGIVTATAETAVKELESRKISLKHMWTGEKLNIVYRHGDEYDAEAMAKIDRFMRDWRCDQVVKIDPKLIDLLWELTQQLKPKGPLRVISGFRSRGLNLSMKRQGRKVDIRSQHSNGKAIDVVFPGVPAKKVRDAALAINSGGVGYYPHSGPPFVHLDTGGTREWAQLVPDGKKRLAAGKNGKTLECTESYQKAG